MLYVEYGDSATAVKMIDNNLDDNNLYIFCLESLGRLVLLIVINNESPDLMIILLY